MSWRDVADDRRASIKTLRAYNDRACTKCEDLLERSEKATAALEDARDNMSQVMDTLILESSTDIAGHMAVHDQIAEAICQLAPDTSDDDAGDDDADDNAEL